MRIENKIQASCVEWFKNQFCLKHHKPRYEIFSVPNEATYSNNNFKALGIRDGVSDTVVVLNKEVLFIEFKDPKGSQSEEQEDFEKLVTDLGHSYYIVRSIEQFKEVIYDRIN